MLHIGIDVHQKSSVFNVFDPAEGDGGTHRSQKVETTAEGFRRVLEPLAGPCEVVFEVGPMTQWVAALVRPYAVKLTVANPSRIPWLFRAGRKNDRIDAQKLSILSYLGQVPKVHLPPPEVSEWRGLINERDDWQGDRYDESSRTARGESYSDQVRGTLPRRGCSAKGALGSRTTPQDTWDEPEERGWASGDLARGLLRSPTTENGPSTNSLMCPTLGGELTLKKWML